MSDESTTTDSGSESNPQGAGASDAGSTSEGSGAGTAGVPVSTGTTSVTDAEERARSWQAKADRESARVAQLERELAAAKEGTTPAASDTPAASAADIHNVMQMYASVESVKQAYPEANAALFADLSQYGNVEALKVAAARSHEARVAEKDAMRKEVDAELRGRYEKVLGELPNLDGPPEGGEKPEGMPTIAQLAKMSFSERAAFEDANPGATAKILAGSTPDRLIGGGIQ